MGGGGADDYTGKFEILPHTSGTFDIPTYHSLAQSNRSFWLQLGGPFWSFKRHGKPASHFWATNPVVEALSGNTEKLSAHETSLVPAQRPPCVQNSDFVRRHARELVNASSRLRDGFFALHIRRGDKQMEKAHSGVPLVQLVADKVFCGSINTSSINTSMRPVPVYIMSNTKDRHYKDSLGAALRDLKCISSVMWENDWEALKPLYRKYDDNFLLYLVSKAITDHARYEPVSFLLQWSPQGRRTPHIRLIRLRCALTSCCRFDSTAILAQPCHRASFLVQR
jgi:hypothetical protein